jgi:hypothetical protein
MPTMRGRALGAILLLSVVSVGLDVTPNILQSDASATTEAPVCLTSQLHMNTEKGASSFTGIFSVPLYFTNTGTTCALLSDAPGVQAVRGKHHRHVGDSTPNDLVAVTPVVLEKGQRALSNLLVITAGVSQKAKCQPVTTTGILVSAGMPLRSTKYLPLVLHDVCSGASFNNLADTHYA